MNNLLYVDATQLTLFASIVAPALSGVCVWWTTQVIASLIGGARILPEGKYERMRRAKLRHSNWILKSAEPLIDEVSAALGEEFNHPQADLSRALRRHPVWRDWSASEFLAVKIVEGFLVGIGVFLMVWPMGYLWLALILAVGSIVFYPIISRKSVISNSEKHIHRLRSRLPFTVDQVALMMGAGAGFEECLRTVVADDPLHPLSEELAMVLADCEAGRTRREAMLDLRTRIPDQDIADFVFAVVKGEELGTPLGNILADQAEQMRIRRAQWGEKAAAEAEVQIVFPGMLVMLACLMVVVAPMVLPAAFNIFSN
jgi:Flp pilus assembly protein TadB